jgi:hypothetical protein
MKNLTLFQCPKFQHCNAPVCPLDSDWQKRKHINGDRVCFFLMEAQKLNAKAVFEVRSLGYLYQLMVTYTPEITGKYNVIKTAIEKAKTSSSRMARKIGAK